MLNSNERGAQNGNQIWSQVVARILLRDGGLSAASRFQVLALKAEGEYSCQHADCCNVSKTTDRATVEANTIVIIIIICTISTSERTGARSGNRCGAINVILKDNAAVRGWRYDTTCHGSYKTLERRQMLSKS